MRPLSGTSTAGTDWRGGPQPWQTGWLVPVHVPVPTPVGTTNDPATEPPREDTMKKNIHPDYTETSVTCTCGNTFTTRSTVTSGSNHSDECAQCHPF